MSKELSRRRFLASSGSVGGAAWLKLTSPALAAVTASACSARDAESPFVTLSESEAREIAAIAARLIPTTDTPGAEEAGVIYFIDRALPERMFGSLDQFRSGLAAFSEALAVDHPDGTFSELPAETQDAFLATQEGGEFFEFVRVLTICGFFAMSSHGGNRDHVSWKLIGFEGHGAFAHPFGYYDGEAVEHGG